MRNGISVGGTVLYKTLEGISTLCEGALAHRSHTRRAPEEAVERGITALVPPSEVPVRFLAVSYRSPNAPHMASALAAVGPGGGGRVRGCRTPAPGIVVGNLEQRPRARRKLSEFPCVQACRVCT